MAIYYTQILNTETKKILTGSFSHAGAPLKADKSILVELKSASLRLPAQQKIFNLHSTKKNNLFYFKQAQGLTLCSIVDSRTTDKLVAKYFEEVEKEFTAKHCDFKVQHYDFDEKLKTIADKYNKNKNVFAGAEELEKTHATLVENLDSLIHRGESLNTLNEQVEKMSMNTREMSKRVQQMKLNARIEQYKIYGVIIAGILVFILFFLLR